MKTIEYANSSSCDSAFAINAPGSASSCSQVLDESCSGTVTATLGDNRNIQSIYRSHEYEELPNSRCYDDVLIL